MNKSIEFDSFSRKGVTYLIVPIGEDTLMSAPDVGKFLGYKSPMFSCRNKELLPEPDVDAKGLKMYRKSAVLSRYLMLKTGIGGLFEVNKQDEPA